MNEFFSKLIFSTRNFFVGFASDSLQDILSNNIILFTIFFVIFSSIYKLIKSISIKFIHKNLNKTFPQSVIVNSFIQNKILNISFVFMYFFVLYSSLENFSFSSFFIKLFFFGVAISSFLWINRVIDFCNKIYSTLALANSMPIKGYLQLAKIVLSLIIIIISIGVLVDKSPKILLGGIGALTAVILLIFRDTILSAVASLQIFSNRLIAPKDWITVPSLKVDGEVEEVNLHHVIIKNWDKSLSILPIYQLVNTSFKNWSNMYKEGRRIAQSFWINQETIVFLGLQKIKKFEKIIGDKATPGKTKKTNLFYFRQYAYSYLKNHDQIDSNNTLLVRNLKSTIDGLQMEVYAFCLETRWEKYEQIQSEVMEHLTAMAEVFDLKIFQRKI